MLKKYPFVKQNGIYDCGVATLLMIIRYYHGDIPYLQLREMLKTSNNGTTAYHIVKCANELGFKAEGLHISYENVTLPAIAHTIIDNYKHFIVIYEIDYKKKELLIADPTDKISKISFNKFNEIYNNIIITLYPIQKIPIYKKNKSLLKFVHSILIKNKKHFIGIIILSFIVMILSILGTLSFSYMINGISKSKNYLVTILYLFLFIIIFKNVLSFIRIKIFIKFNYKIDIKLTNEVFKNIVKLPYKMYRNHTTGDIVSRIKDLETIREMISKIALIIFIDLFLMIFSALFLYIINPWLFSVAILLIISYIILLIIYKPIYQKYINKIQIKQAQNHSHMIEAITGFEMVKGLNIEQEIIANFDNKYLDYINHISKLDNHINNQILIKSLCNDIACLLIIFIGALLVLNNKFNITSIVTFQMMLLYFIEPMNRILELDTLIYDSKGAYNRINDLSYIEEDKKGINSISKGKITLNNLSYIHNDVDILLENINLSIEKGDKLIIIGPSGSGKSTLLKVLKGYYSVNDNYYLIDDICSNKFHKSIFKNIIYISQNEILLSDSIYENIRLFRETKNEDIKNSALICEVDKFVDNKLGYNYLIEENGFNISGGEKQKIILARSILKPFEILLIDEGFSQIDKNSERIIIKNILKKYKDKTIIIVSHKFDNIDLFDKVIKMKQGKIEEVIEKSK